MQHVTAELADPIAQFHAWMGEAEKAKGYYARLSPRDQRKIARRCQRYGIEF